MMITDAMESRWTQGQIDGYLDEIARQEAEVEWWDEHYPNWEWDSMSSEEKARLVDEAIAYDYLDDAHEDCEPGYCMNTYGKWD